VRLELTRRSDLALRALLELDHAEARTKGAALAARVGTTSGFLAQAASLDDVSVLELIETCEGPTDTGRCVLVGDACPPNQTCALHEPWTRARDALTAELSRTPLAEARHRSLTAAGRSRTDTEESP
jgi:DNA-binding IscR family transcriptional regulator